MTLRGRGNQNDRDKWRKYTATTFQFQFQFISLIELKQQFARKLQRVDAVRI